MTLQVPANWKPTAESINALPKPIRAYIHDLETRCDPANEVAELTMLRDTAAAAIDDGNAKAAFLVDLLSVFKNPKNWKVREGVDHATKEPITELTWQGEMLPGDFVAMANEIYLYGSWHEFDYSNPEGYPPSDGWYLVCDPLRERNQQLVWHWDERYEHWSEDQYFPAFNVSHWRVLPKLPTAKATDTTEQTDGREK